MKTILGAILLLGSAASSTAPVPRDWSQTAVDDLHFIRAILRENHPGPVDAENPRFLDWYRRGFEGALERARKTKDFAGYFFSVGYYMAGFHDGHLGALVERHIEDHLSEKRLDRRWPGFVVGYENGSFVVTNVDPNLRGGPQSGDRLLACDGRAADDWAREIIGEYSGLWFLPGERSVLAPLLAIDEGNPFVRVPEQCTFQPASGGRTYAARLHWMRTTGAELLAALPKTRSPQPGLRRAGADRTAYWITIPSLALGDPATGAALKTLTEEVRAAAPEIRASREVVFDVRGNRGGSSEAGRALLAAIWGDSAVVSVQPLPAAIDWRLSSGNVRFLRDANLRSLRRQFGDDSPKAREYERMIVEMEGALARGDVFFREITHPPETVAKTAPAGARPILLTDNVCASACLDFADIVLRLPGAMHYGRETSADALYIDNRTISLPSGIGVLGFSMKVYRGRIRGDNETYRPANVWKGDIEDTAALEKWILGGQ